MRRTPRTRRDRPAVERPQVVAHRGSSHEKAEHTLAAYVKALDEGAEALECDVRLTADGHLVCVHDRNLRRTAATPGIVSTMNLAELDELDFASWKNPWADLDDEAPDQDPDAGKVLTLRKLLETVADYDRHVELAVETKHPTRYGGLVERRLVEVLGDFGWDRAGSPARVMSFSRTAVTRVRRLAPELDVVMLVDKAHHWPDAAPGRRRRLDHRPRRSRSCATTPGSGGTWSRRGARSTCGRSTPPTTSTSASTSASPRSSATGRRTCWSCWAAEPSLAALRGPRGGQLGSAMAKKSRNRTHVRTRRRRGRPPPALSVRLGQALQGLPRCGRRRSPDLRRPSLRGHAERVRRDRAARAGPGRHGPAHAEGRRPRPSASRPCCPAPRRRWCASRATSGSACRSSTPTATRPATWAPSSRPRWPPRSPASSA